MGKNRHVVRHESQRKFVSWDEYFLPEHLGRYVTRREIAALLELQMADWYGTLQAYHRGVVARRWYRRLWGALRRALPAGLRWKLMSSDERVAAVVGLVRAGKPQGAELTVERLTEVLRAYPLSADELSRAARLLGISETAEVTK